MKRALSCFGTPAPTGYAINYAAHEGQLEVKKMISLNFRSDNPAAIVEIAASRGWGKTLFLCCEILIPYLETHPGAKVMWVAPTYLVSMSPIDDVFRGINEVNGERFIPEQDIQGNKIWEFVTTRSGPVLKWWNGATVVFRSADSPDSIVSRGFNLIIMDEAALIQERVFTMQILGTARKQGIKIFMITSPRGKRHWTYNIFLKGQDPKDSMYLSFQQPYYKNPYFSKILETLMKDIPEWMRRQEYYAEFIDDGESVIKGLEAVLFGPEISFPSQQQEWEMPTLDKFNDKGELVISGNNRRFIVSVDFAKQIDFTVILAMDLDTGEIVYYRRLNKLDYTKVLPIITEVCNKHNGAELIFDATGVGNALADYINAENITSYPFVFTNESKTDAINQLVLAIEYQQLAIPNITTMKNELSVLTYTLTKLGKISYSAPSGYHDDIVMSLAMANWFKRNNQGTDDIGVIDSVIEYNNRNLSSSSFIDRMMNDND